MSMLGKRIKVKGIDQRGKNRVREHGDMWHVLAETDVILFAPSKQGPWIFIVPLGMTLLDKPSRWMHVTNDLTFELVEVLT